MEFEYLLLAESANASEGKMNALGLGIRVFTAETLPSPIQFSIVGGVVGGAEDVGTYDVSVGITSPDGTREEIVNSTVGLSTEGDDPRLPSGIAFTIAVLRPFAAEGIYTVDAHVGPCEATYNFVIKVARTRSESVGASGEPKPRSRAKKTKAVAAAG